MEKYEVISLDMFQTLVNIHTRRDFIWRRILGEDYSKELEEKYAELIEKKILEKFHEHTSVANNFSDLKTIFLKYFTEAFEENKLNLNPVDATKIFVEEHGLAESYEDSDLFLKTTSKNYKICLVSDADIEMVQPLLGRFSFDKVFISEEYMSYKNDSESKIFKKVLEHYKVEPKKILHIGDSSSDILGANSVGITTCWINRHNYKWRYEVEPMYKVNSLAEVLKLLNIEINV